jgi:hypothetical protein
MGPGLVSFAFFIIYPVKVVFAALEKIFFLEEVLFELVSSLVSYLPGPISSFSEFRHKST